VIRLLLRWWREFNAVGEYRCENPDHRVEGGPR